jgi:hypothetical protein
MRSAVYIASLWPGFAQAWIWGNWRGLLLAIGFAGALNLALTVTFAWPRWPAEAPAGTTAAAAWLLVLGLWGLGFAGLRRDWGKLATRQKPGANAEVESWFTAAQAEYLKGHWLEAETLVRQILARQPGDAEAWLLLVSLHRRTGRHAEARRSLIEMKDMPAAAKWSREIETELAHLSKQANEGIGTARETRRAQDAPPEPTGDGDVADAPPYKRRRAA